MAENVKPKRVTMRDVAAEAGVSLSTVSLFTQGRDGVSDEMSRRIAAAIERTGYVPRARTESGADGYFGLFLEKLSLSAFPETLYGAIIHALEVEAKTHGYSMVLSVIEEAVVPDMVRQGKVNGVIILGGSPLNDAVARQIAQTDVPVLLLDSHLAGEPFHAIVPDNEWGGYLAMKHLIDLGHRTIGILQGPPKYRTLTDRLWGARRAAYELGVDIPPEYQPADQSSGHPRKGYREMQALLALPQPPTAVFAVSDKTAFGALDAIRDAGLKVPGDLSIIGFDNEVRAEHTRPPLTTVHLPKRYLGTLAMRTLVNLIENPPERPLRTCVPVRLVRRESTSAPP